MKAKRILAAAAALTLAAALAAPALAAGNPTTDTVSGTNGSTSHSTTFTGTIQPQNISVVMPTAVTFDVDPTKTGDDKIVTDTKPTVTFTNNSVVPVYLSVTGAGTSDGVTLVQAAAGLTADKAVMFGIKKSGGSVYDYLSTSMAPALQVGELKAAGATGDALNLDWQVNTTTGWASGNTFAVTPVFVVSANAPAAS